MFITASIRYKQPYNYTVQRIRLCIGIVHSWIRWMAPALTIKYTICDARVLKATFNYIRL